LEVAIKPHTFQGKEWDPKKHVQEMPTDAFGDIVFTDLSQKVGKVGSVFLSPFSVLAPGTR
jgi:transient receptor potential cation channel subfamily M protein 2